MASLSREVVAMVLVAKAMVLLMMELI